MHRLPNRYGCITKLSGNRRRPYVIKSPMGKNAQGRQLYAVVGYAATKQDALDLLAQFHTNPWDLDLARLTLDGLFELWQKNKAVKLKATTRSTVSSAYKHIKHLGSYRYRELRASHMQATIDNCGHGYSTQGSIKTLWGHLDNYAMELDVINKKYSDLIHSAPIPETTREPFTEDEIKTLWAHVDEPGVDMVLILIYSGWRITEYCGLTVSDIDLDEGTMKGGIKSKAGKGRIVPIHSRIRPLIEARLADGRPYLQMGKHGACSAASCREEFNTVMVRLGMHHVPHECRHTFETRLDDAEANRRCIDLMMGHTSKDTGNRVYNHKNIEMLRKAIELLS